MFKQWSGLVKWSISPLLVTICMINDCMHPCHITHWSPMLKQWPGMVKWSISSLLFAIFMIYDCMHPCCIAHWISMIYVHHTLTISMIYDCIHPCTLRSLCHLHDICTSQIDHLHDISSDDCIHPCHITHWALFAISVIYHCMHPCHITHWLGSLDGQMVSIIAALPHLHDI